MKKWRWLDVHPNMKVKIDEEDFDRVNQHSWRVTKGTTGRIRVVTSYREKGKVKTMTLGKFLMKPETGMQVYPRRFNDGLDYRKDNLIVCTLKDRQRLLPKNRKHKSSQYRGVSFSAKEKKWRAGIEVNGKAINLGNFDDEDDAALAYNQAAKKHFGDIAYQNKIIKEKKRDEDKGS
jgi:hypothetical protein